MKVESGIYRHFKGGTVSVLGIATHSESQEDLVVYVGLQNGKLCARPLSSFCEIVTDKEGKQVSRFAFEEERGDLIKEICKKENTK